MMILSGAAFMNTALAGEENYVYTSGYWQEYLDEKIKSIPEGKSFIFFTDVHWRGNEKHCTDIISYIREKTGIRKVLFGGDCLGYAADKNDAKVKYGTFLLEERAAFGSDFIPCVGDHDYNMANPAMTADTMGDYFITYPVMRDLFMGDLKDIYHCYEPAEKLKEYCSGEVYDAVMDFFGTVYYLDDTENETRYIVLNCGCGTKYGDVYDVFGVTGTETLRLQFDFLAESLMGTPEGWNVVVLSHKAGFNSSGLTTTMAKIVSGFVRKDSGCRMNPPSARGTAADKWWNSKAEYDFSAAPDVGIVICVEGHVHSDRLTWFGLDGNGNWVNKQDYDGARALDQKKLGQIPFIVTHTDCAGQKDDMTPGTVTEQCIDIVTLTADGVHITRVGPGNDRDVLIGE